MAVCCHAYIGKKKGLDTHIMTSVCDVWSWTEFHRKSVSMMDHNKTESDGVKDLYSILYTINVNDKVEILSKLWYTENYCNKLCLIKQYFMAASSHAQRTCDLINKM